MNTLVQHHLVVGDGVIGCAVARTFATQGIACTLASRSASREPPGAMPHRVIDASNRASLLAATADASHVYITLGLPYEVRTWECTWPLIIDNFIAAARRHRFKLIFFDNIYMYGPTPLRIPMREDHPQQPTTRKGRVRKVLADKLLAAARDEGLQVAIGRCADFYGPGMRNSMLYSAAIKRQLAGKEAQFIGDPDRLHSYSYTEDAARGLVRLALDDGALGKAWHLPTAELATTPRALLERTAALCGAPSKLAVMPPMVFNLLKWLIPVLRELDEMLYQQRDDYVFSSKTFMERYPDFCVTPYNEGLEMMIRSFRLVALAESVPMGSPSKAK